MKVLLTGAGGFIGFHVGVALAKRGDLIVGIDNLNDYYDVRLKEARRDIFASEKNTKFIKADLADRTATEAIFADEKPDRVIHLAAQAGVRYGFVNPHAYINSNIVGFINVLEGCRHHDVEHLVYASTSSVYGANTELPFAVTQNVDHPLSLYAATKKSNELMAHSYAHLYGLPVTGLRFFTVYGPWGRPDMSLFLFTKKILADEPIDVFNNGDHARDFTYIDDVAAVVMRALDKIATPNRDWDGLNRDPSTSSAPYRLYNVGNNQPVELMHFIECIEKALGKTAKKNFLPLQPGDVARTYADTDGLARDIGFRPEMPIEKGIHRFVEWYRHYYRV